MALRERNERSMDEHTQRQPAALPVRAVAQCFVAPQRRRAVDTPMMDLPQVHHALIGWRVCGAGKSGPSARIARGCKMALRAAGGARPKIPQHRGLSYTTGLKPPSILIAVPVM
jgi:hypothetical protein